MEKCVCERVRERERGESSDVKDGKRRTQKMQEIHVIGRKLRCF